MRSRKVLWKYAGITRAVVVSAVAAAAAVTTNISPIHAQAFPDSVKDFSPGRNAGFGAAYFPANVLGPPQGTSNPQVPNANQQDLLSLGTGGSITLEFSTHRVINGPGADFTIFENPVQPINFPEQSFVDSAIVSVSEDGDTWIAFPVDLVSTSTSQLRYKNNYVGFAGIMPTYSNPANGISPFDPGVSGGDQFDLEDIGLAAVRFIRITDTGDAAYKPTYDKDGDLVNDYGNFLDPDPTQNGLGISAGFDLDAVAAIHTEPWSPPAGIVTWSLYD